MALLDDFFQEVGRQTGPLTEERLSTQGHVQKVVSTIEGKLYRVLNGSVLRGCPNLLTHEKPVYGYNVRKQQKTAKLHFPDGDDDVVEALVLTREGTFSMVEVALDPIPSGLDRNRIQITDRLRVEIMDPEPEDIQIEDFHNICQTVVEACVKHLLHSQKTTENTKRVRELADSVLGALLEANQ